MEHDTGPARSLSKLEARVLLSIQKNLTFISLGNLRVDWPDCDGEKQDWHEPLHSLTRQEHILAYEAGRWSGKTKLSPVRDLDFKRELVFKLSPSGKRLLAEAKKVALGEPMPTLVHNVRDGTWKVIR